MPGSLYPKRSFREKYAVELQNLNVVINWLSLILITFAIGIIVGEVL